MTWRENHIWQQNQMEMAGAFRHDPYREFCPRGQKKRIRGFYDGTDPEAIEELMHDIRNPEKRIKSLN